MDRQVRLSVGFASQEIIGVSIRQTMAPSSTEKWTKGCELVIPGLGDDAAARRAGSPRRLLCQEDLFHNPLFIGRQDSVLVKIPACAWGQLL